MHVSAYVISQKENICEVHPIELTCPEARNGLITLLSFFYLKTEVYLLPKTYVFESRTGLWTLTNKFVN
jgi:hypothetical protein